MRVILVGDFRHDRLGASYQRAFLGLGHEVKTFDVTEQSLALAWWVRERIPHRLTIRSIHARRAGAIGYNGRLLELCAQWRPDLILAFNGDFVMPETIRTIRSKGVRFCIFHADNPFPPHYNNRPETLDGAKECDVYFIWSEAVAQRLRSLGIKARFLAFAWDSEVFPYRGPPGDQPYDVSFIGGWDPEREELLNAIAEEFQLNIWGPEYWGSRTRKSSPSRHCWRGRELGGAEAANVIAKSKIMINPLRRQHYTDDQADGVIMRTFEVPGTGGFLLSTRATGALEIFPEGEAAAYYADLKECCDRIEYYLANDAERSKVAGLAHRLVEREHQYSHRVNELLRELG